MVGESNIPVFEAYARAGLLVVSDGGDDRIFLGEARRYAREANIPMHFAKDEGRTVVRYNYGFPSNIPAFSLSARRWTQMSCTYREQSAYWNKLLVRGGC